MTAPAVSVSSGSTLIPTRLRWPHSLDRLDRLLTVPEGFRKEMSDGRLRIGRLHRHVDDALLELADRIAEELPEGFSLEVYSGRIVIGGARARNHDRVVQELDEELRGPAEERDWLVFRTAGVTDPRLRVHTVPDLLMVPADAPLYGTALRGEDVLLAAEVTAPDSARDDREHKRRFYGTAGVPIYLLIDREHSEAVLHTVPIEDGYTRLTRTPLGRPLHLPAPLGLPLDTAALLR